MKKADLTIWKEDRQIAKAERCTPGIIPGEAFGGLESVHCYYFPQVKLAPPVLFEHLAGTALMQFLDHCSLVFDEEACDMVDGLRYVHGRSETMKGSSRISAVLLAKPKGGPMDDPTWMIHLPAIYKRFLDTMSAGTKTA